MYVLYIIIGIYLCFVFAAAALKGVCLEVGRADESTEVTDVHPVGIGGREEPLMEELSGAVSDLAVSLHLPKPESPVARPALHGLSGEDLHGTTRAGVDLVVHHVSQSLVVGRPQEHLRVELAAGEAVVEDLVATEMVAILVEQLGYLLDVDCVVEGSCVSDLTLVG